MSFAGALAALAVAIAGRAQREQGFFSPNYVGGNHFKYDDPGAQGLKNLLFDVDDVNMTCSNDERIASFEEQIRGVNIGGWLVLEPWITPSMFYQFLGADKRFGDAALDHTGMDMYTFCKALGPAEANRQLRRHWKTWVTEDDIRELYRLGINSLRVPVGDWMWRPYGPYVNCTTGAIEELDRLIDLASEYGLKVLIDLHGVEGSQNGLDNSGITANLRWTSVQSRPPVGLTVFAHWDNRAANWIGTWDVDRLGYSELYWDRIEDAIDVIRQITDRYKSRAAVMGVQPVNEPWQFTPLGALKRYYWEAYKVVKRRAPGWRFFMHDSFRLSTGLWHGFMSGCPDRMMDTHIYSAWDPPTHEADFYYHACAKRHLIAEYEREVMPLVVGEWSLATDNCAMWLNGFNDNLPGYPMVACDYIECPVPYMGPDQPGAPPSKGMPPQGPFGMGQSTPSHGMCPVDKSWPNDDEIMTNLAHKKLNAFSYGHGWFFWNFKTELEPKWDYIRAANRGWFPVAAPRSSREVQHACEDERDSDFECRVRPTATRKELLAGLQWACGEGLVDIPDCQAGPDELIANAARIFNTYWQAMHVQGATCDFHGAAELIDLKPAPDLPVLRAGEDSQAPGAAPGGGGGGGGATVLQRLGYDSSGSGVPLFIACAGIVAAVAASLAAIGAVGETAKAVLRRSLDQQKSGGCYGRGGDDEAYGEDDALCPRTVRGTAAARLGALRRSWHARLLSRNTLTDRLV